LLIKGLAKVSPMSGLTLNAIGVQAQPYPNAAKAFLQVHAGEGAVRTLAKRQQRLLGAAAGGLRPMPRCGRANPKVADLKDTMKATIYNAYNGPISTATGAVNADYVLVQMWRPVATDAATPEAAASQRQSAGEAVFSQVVGWIRKIEKPSFALRQSAGRLRKERKRRSILLSSSGEMDCFCFARNDERKIY